MVWSVAKPMSWGRYSTSPPRLASPVPAGRRPASTLSSVVLPLPFSPTSPQCSPGGTLKLTS